MHAETPPTCHLRDLQWFLRAYISRQQPIHPVTHSLPSPTLCRKLKVKDPLYLKVGAQVMCTANLTPFGLANGSRGVVAGFVDAR